MGVVKITVVDVGVPDVANGTSFVIVDACCISLASTWCTMASIKVGTCLCLKGHRKSLIGCHFTLSAVSMHCHMIDDIVGGGLKVIGRGVGAEIGITNICVV